MSIAEYTKSLDGEDFTVVVELNEAGDYYDVYVLNEKYEKSIALQEPKDSIRYPIEYFNDSYMIARLMEHFIWDRFYDVGIISPSVTIEIEEH